MILGVLFLIFCCSRTVHPTCSPLKEGQPTTLSCNVNIERCPTHNLLAWTVGSQQVARCVREKRCFPVESSFSVTLDSSGKSTLTINSMSRADPFNMEGNWTCQPCLGDAVTACNKLKAYSLAKNPTCTVSENTESGDIKSVHISCSTSKVYPKAKCRFYRRKNGGNPVQIRTTPSYSHTETGETPVYYRSECSVTVSVRELGEGTHSFRGYIYPDVTVGLSKVKGTPADNIVNLSFPQASHSCLSQIVQGYFQDDSTTCTCSLSYDGYPKGTAQWYKRDQRVGSSGTLVVSRDRSCPEQTFTCEAVSDLGRRVRSTLIAKFSYAPNVTFTVEPAHTLFSNGSKLELKCSGQGKPDPTLILTKKETNANLTNVQTTELTHTLYLDCMDTGVYVCAGQNSKATTTQEISIGVSCPQQPNPLFYPTNKVDPSIQAIMGDTAHIDLEIYGYPEPTILALHRLSDDTDLTSSPRHSVTYTARAAPFGAVNVTISDLVEADFTVYTLTVDNGVGEALEYIFYLNQVDANDGDRLNIAAIVIGVIALVIFAGLIVVIIVLWKKNRDVETYPQNHQNCDYLVPLELSTIEDPIFVSASVPPTQRQYATIQATTDNPYVSTSYATETAQYETIKDMASTSGTHNCTSPLDVESPEFYRGLEPNISTIRNHTSSVHYRNISGQHGGILETAL